MGPTKTPEPDGFPALFYQTRWDFLKDDICGVVRSFLAGGDIPIFYLFGDCAHSEYQQP
jgi:uncharacterized RDD family membrane protein YckC